MDARRLKATLKTARIGMWEVSLPDRILDASAECKANYGRLPSDEFTYPILFQTIHPLDRDHMAATVDHAIKAGEEFVLEYRCVWPDGSVHWIAVNGIVLFHDDGRPEKIVGITQEITSRKQIENELRDAKARITSMLDAVQVATWAVDLLNDRVTPDRNLTRMFFLTDEEAHGSMQNYLRRVHPDDRPMVDDAMKKVFADPDATYRMEPRVVSPEGTVRWLEVRGSVERDATGRPIVFRGVVLDITDRKAGEELQSRLSASHHLLKVQEEERKRIARDLHDSAGQTLASLCMNVEILASKAKTEAPTLEKVARECSDAAQQLSKELRTTSYLLHPPLLDEVGLAAALAWYVEGLETRSGLKINLNMPPDWRRIDPSLEMVIFRLVQECLTNIYRHAGSKTATIGLATDGKEVNLTVADKGKGMSPEKLAALQGRSSGVGLQGMRERVRQINGQMELQSGSTGTNVTFRLPINNHS